MKLSTVLCLMLSVLLFCLGYFFLQETIKSIKLIEDINVKKAISGACYLYVVWLFWAALKESYQSMNQE